MKVNHKYEFVRGILREMDSKMAQLKIRKQMRQRLGRFRIGPLGLLICISTFFLVSCASLLPPERRVYPKNPVSLPKGMDIHDWMYTKKKQFPNQLLVHTPYGVVYKMMFFRKQKTFLGSYISCSAYIRQIDGKFIELIEIASIINYSDYTKSVGRYNKGGELGPMSENERTEILLPCIEEFLEPPGNQQ
ncbi:hypothetical protein [Leptospira levettii]|uniref:hypothetical protein n=1 Tax=Leptospira levettii TaxID=2023178 RepID=UPI001FAFAFE1|nr:hypothetical protein [Leptospira levettii]MCW7473618.1 hypothetical protein [Leptospira levettii]